MFSHRIENTSTKMNKMNENLHYMSDVRGNTELLEKTSKKNLMPDQDLEEILDKFILMEKIGNVQGFIQSMRFIMNEIKGRFPKTTVFLEKVEICYEKLMGVLIEKNKELLNENSMKNEERSNLEKKMKIDIEEKMQNEMKINKMTNEKKNQRNMECQTEPDFYLIERMEQINRENHELEGQNNRMMMLLKNLNKRGIDIEKLFEKQMDALLNLNNKMSLSEIRKLNIDSEEGLFSLFHFYFN